MTRRVVALVAIVVTVVALGGLAALGRPSASTGPSTTPDSAAFSLAARVADRPSGGDPGQIAVIPSVRLARVLGESKVYGAIGGTPLQDGQGFDLTLPAGIDLAVFEGPIAVGGQLWFRVYVLPNASLGPTDFFAWLPLHGPQGADAIGFEDPPVCPDDRGIPALGALDPFTRASCLGAASFALRGWTWDRMLPTWYRITPEWLGEQNGTIDSTMSLNDARLHRGTGGGGPFPFVELQLPPGLERPPFEFQIDVSVHVADPVSGTCLRTPDQFGFTPADDPRDGRLWCATRLVIERWTPLLGPEERAIDPAAPQLHRHRNQGACAGVGMPVLIFRMDPTKLDPVWLEEANGNGVRVIPNFGPAFRAAFTPALVITDEHGRVIAQDGTVVNPDGQVAGHSICPTGRVVYLD